MRRFVAILLLGAAVLASLPQVTANESAADCEDSVTWTADNKPETPDPYGGQSHEQPWIGYGTTDAQRALWYGLVDNDRVFRNCEGEHWDGQDRLSDDDPGTGPTCTKGQIDPNPNNLFVGSCMSPDPNQGAADPLAGNGQPLTFRVSTKSAGTTQEAYTAENIALVGRAAVYVGECQGGGAGLEGESACEGSGQQRVGVYLRDDTPGNILAGVVSAAGITKGYPSEADCTQSEYEKGAYEGNKRPEDGACGRDNTAITVELNEP